MARAQSLQTQISAAQNSLAKMHIKGISENGLVIVDMTGKYDILSVKIDDKALSFGAQKLSEMVTAACADAKSKADVLIDKTMSAITNGASE